MSLSRILTFIGKSIIGALLAALLLLALLFAYVSIYLPSVESLKTVHLQSPLSIFSKDGELIAEFGDIRRTPVLYKDIPQPLIDAVLATEDQHFYEHPGVDFLGLARAAVVLVSTGHKTQGGSTITMQVARNFFLSNKKTFARKFNEILLAIKIDHELGKQAILELYFNKVFLGEHAYGFGAAAQVYYGKPLNELTLAEYAMLAGLPKAPSTANPIVNPKKARERRHHVLSRMLEGGFITPEEFEEANEAPLVEKYHGLSVSLAAPYVAEMIRSQLYDKYGDVIYSQGLNVHTTINGRLQREANRALREGILAYDRRHGYRGPEKNIGTYNPEQQSAWEKILATLPNQYDLLPAAVIQVDEKNAQALLADGQVITLPWQSISWAQPVMKNHQLGKIPETADEVLHVGDIIRIYQLPNKSWMLSQSPIVEGALVAMDPKSGAILAMAGGIDFSKSHFNRVIQAHRQVGSSIKPFIYAAAISKGMTLATIENDSPIVIEDGSGQTWRPENDDHQFHGSVRMRESLVDSLNLASIRILQQTGIPYTIQFLEKFGFDPKQMPEGLSLALGTPDLTPLQLANSFARFANGGYQLDAYLIQSITDDHQEILYKVKKIKLCQNNEDVLDQTIEQYQCAPQTVDSHIIYLLDSAMQDVVGRGTGKQARILNRQDLAGKTGTSNDQRDAWFSGFNQNIVTVVWVGYDTPKSLGEYGGQAALPIWIDFMRAALKGMPETSLQRPEGIISVRIDPQNGLRVPASHNPSIFEIFKAGTEPSMEGDAENTETSMSNQNDSQQNKNPSLSDLY
ncbi:MAG: penicillin-binding protein 1A [Gammaproteobacteria bacterium]|nr:penicillin-binding protein 1A [Gammaproteobacteria bacterium]